MQIKITTKYHLRHIGMIIIKATGNECWRECGEIGNLVTVGGNAKWFSNYEKQHGGSSKGQK